MKLGEKLDQITGKRDTLARRVLNTAPDTLANITADQIMRGVTLEELERVNVPVYRYDTQVTIHGIIPGVNPGNKLCTVNGNGSIGVRYAAIDAAKKRILSRCERVASSPWTSHMDSTGLYITRYFIVNDESKREEIKSACMECLKNVKYDLFYGWVGCFALQWGSGYAVQCFIGAIPAENVWPLAEDFFGIADTETLESMEAAKKAVNDAEAAARNARWEAEAKAKAEETARAMDELKVFLSGHTGERVRVISKKPCKFRFYSHVKNESGEFTIKTVEIAKRGPFLCVKVTPPLYGAKFRKMENKDWERYEKAASQGLLFA